MNNDETTELKLKFDEHGLMGAIVVDAHDGSVLMFAHMNAEAFAKTVETSFIHFWSRSRQKLWMKGETSGNRLAVVDLLTDCDDDTVLVRVRREGDGLVCHTGQRTCFFRTVASTEQTA